MGDNVLSGERMLFMGKSMADIKLLGKVMECSASIESEEESDYIPTKDSFSFSFEMPSLSKWFEERAYLKPIQEAQDMLTRLRDYHALWHKYYGFGMRKERRKIERNFNALAKRFALHCKIYNITIRPNNNNQSKN